MLVFTTLQCSPCIIVGAALGWEEQAQGVPVEGTVPVLASRTARCYCPYFHTWPLSLWVNGPHSWDPELSVFRVTKSVCHVPVGFFVKRAFKHDPINAAPKISSVGWPYGQLSSGNALRTGLLYCLVQRSVRMTSSDQWRCEFLEQDKPNGKVCL